MRSLPWFYATVLVVVVVGCAPRTASGAHQQGTLPVRVRVDREGNGWLTPTCGFSGAARAGDPVCLTIAVAADAYVYLFDVAADGIVRQVFPFRFGGVDGALDLAGRPLVVCPEGAAYTLSVEPPYGAGRVIALASRVPLETRSLTSYVAVGQGAELPGISCGVDRGPTRARSLAGFERVLAIVVGPLPCEERWTDVVRPWIKSR